MAPRANWKGYLQIGDLTCPVALYTAASTSERIAFHTLNRKTGHRVHREYVDVDSGKAVDRDDQTRGYEVAKGDYVMLSDEDLKSAVPQSDKTLAVEAFIACDDIDKVYFDRPYYLAPSDRGADESYSLIVNALKAKESTALARTVLFRRLRTVLIRPYDKGLIATTLNFDYEIRSAQEAFDEIPDIQIKGEMLDLAKHIIDTKAGEFDPRKFDDRYEAALAALVQAKIEGKPIAKPAPRKDAKVVDLMEALRQSAGVAAQNEKKTKPTRKKRASSSKKPATKRTPAARRKAS